MTDGPGLVGALLTGVSYAKALAWALDKPLIGVNHIEGHVSANYLAHPDLTPPFCCLVASGGHSHIVKVERYGHYKMCIRDSIGADEHEPGLAQGKQPGKAVEHVHAHRHQGVGLSLIHI